MALILIIKLLKWIGITNDSHMSNTNQCVNTCPSYKLQQDVLTNMHLFNTLDFEGCEEKETQHSRLVWSNSPNNHPMFDSNVEDLAKIEVILVENQHEEHSHFEDYLRCMLCSPFAMEKVCNDVFEDYLLQRGIDKEFSPLNSSKIHREYSPKITFCTQWRKVSWRSLEMPCMQHLAQGAQRGGAKVKVCLYDSP